MPPVVSLSQINKRKRNFVPKVAVRAPSVQSNQPPSSRQTTTAPSELTGNIGHGADPHSETAQPSDNQSPSTSQRVLSVAENITTPNPPAILAASFATRSPTSVISVEISSSQTRNHSPTSPIRVLPKPISIPSHASHATSPTTSSKYSTRPPLVTKQRHDVPQTASTSVRPGPLPSPRHESVNISDDFAPIPLDSTVSNARVSRLFTSALPTTTPESELQGDQHGKPDALYTSDASRPLFVEPEDSEMTSQEVDLAPEEQGISPHDTLTSTEPNAEHEPSAHRVMQGTVPDNNDTASFAQTPKQKRRRGARKAKSTETTACGDDYAANHLSPPPITSGKRLTRAQSQPHGGGHAAQSCAETEGDDGAGDNRDDYTPSKRRRRARGLAPTTRSTPGKVRRSRKKRKTAEQVAQEDAEAEGKEHDPTLTTMSALVEDTPIGRSTSTRQQIQERIRANRARDRARREQLRAADRDVTLGKPRDENVEEAQHTARPRTTLETTTDVSTDGNQSNDVDPYAEPAGDGDDGDLEGEGDDFFADIPTSGHVAQISINDEGNVVADELQMEIDRPDTPSHDNYERVFERDTDRFVNSLSHSKRHKGSARWSMAETAIFYHNLAMYGTDFESIARVMPGRTRHEIKNKFNAEDKRNSELINQYLFQPKPIDLDEAARMTGKDLSGPPPRIKGVDDDNVDSVHHEGERVVEAASSLAAAMEPAIDGSGTQEQPSGEMVAGPEPSVTSPALESEMSPLLTPPEDLILT